MTKAQTVRVGLIVAVTAVFVVAIVLVAAYWNPRWTVRYSPWPYPVLIAMARVSGEQSHEADERFVAWGESALPAVRRVLRTGDGEQKRMAIRAAGLASHASVAVTKDPGVRTGILRSLSDHDWRLSTDAFLWILAHGDAETRASAIEWLSRQRDIDFDFRAEVESAMRLRDVDAGEAERILQLVQPRFAPTKDAFQ